MNPYTSDQYCTVPSNLIIQMPLLDQHNNPQHLLLYVARFHMVNLYHMPCCMLEQPVAHYNHYLYQGSAFQHPCGLRHILQLRYDHLLNHIRGCSHEHLYHLLYCSHYQIHVPSQLHQSQHARCMVLSY